MDYGKASSTIVATKLGAAVLPQSCHTVDATIICLRPGAFRHLFVLLCRENRSPLASAILGPGHDLFPAGRNGVFSFREMSFRMLGPFRRGTETSDPWTAGGSDGMPSPMQIRRLFCGAGSI